MIKNLLLVLTGGGVGSVARYGCQKWLAGLSASAFPYPTLLVNISGCLLIGFIYGLAERRQWMTNPWRLLLAAGFCGGFTTFSAFSIENIFLLQEGHFLWSAGYVGGSVVFGLLATWLGLWLARMV